MDLVPYNALSTGLSCRAFMCLPLARKPRRFIIWVLYRYGALLAAVGTGGVSFEHTSPMRIHASPNRLSRGAGCSGFAAISGVRRS